jgi:hypothetical protein
MQSKVRRSGTPAVLDNRGTADNGSRMKSSTPPVTLDRIYIKSGLTKDNLSKQANNASLRSPALTRFVRHSYHQPLGYLIEIDNVDSSVHR